MVNRPVQGIGGARDACYRGSFYGHSYVFSHRHDYRARLGNTQTISCRGAEQAAVGYTHCPELGLALVAAAGRPAEADLRAREARLRTGHACSLESSEWRERLSRKSLTAGEPIVHGKSIVAPTKDGVAGGAQAWGCLSHGAQRKPPGCEPGGKVMGSPDRARFLPTRQAVALFAKPLVRSAGPIRWVGQARPHTLGGASVCLGFLTLRLKPLMLAAIRRESQRRGRRQEPAPAT